MWALLNNCPGHSLEDAQNVGLWRTSEFLGKGLSWPVAASKWRCWSSQELQGGQGMTAYIMLYSSALGIETIPEEKGVRGTPPPLRLHSLMELQHNQREGLANWIQLRDLYGVPIQGWVLEPRVFNMTLVIFQGRTNCGKRTKDNELKHQIARFVQIISLHLKEEKKRATKITEAKNQRRAILQWQHGSLQEEDMSVQLRLYWDLRTFPGLQDRITKLRIKRGDQRTSSIWKNSGSGLLFI